MAIHCVNRSSKEFQELAQQVNLNPVILAAKVSLWQEVNGLDKFPSALDFEIPAMEESEIRTAVEGIVRGPIFSTVKGSNRADLRVARGLGFSTIGNKITYELTPQEKKDYLHYMLASNNKADILDTANGLEIKGRPNYTTIKREKSGEIFAWVDLDSELYKIKLEHLFTGINEVEKKAFLDTVTKEKKSQTKRQQLKEQRLLISERKISSKLMAVYTAREAMKGIRETLKEVHPEGKSVINENYVSTDGKLRISPETMKEVSDLIDTLQEKVMKEIEESEGEQIKPTDPIKTVEEVVAKKLENIAEDLEPEDLEKVTKILEALPLEMLAPIIFSHSRNGYIANNSSSYSSPPVSKQAREVSKNLSRNIYGSSSAFNSVVGSLYMFMEKYPEYGITKEDIKELNQAITKEYDAKWFKKKTSKRIRIIELIKNKAELAKLDGPDAVLKFMQTTEEFMQEAKDYARMNFGSVLTMFNLMQSTFSYLSQFRIEMGMENELAFMLKQTIPKEIDGEQFELRLTPAIVISHELGHLFDMFLAGSNPNLKKAFNKFASGIVEQANLSDASKENPFSKYSREGLRIRGYNSDNIKEIIPDIFASVIMIVANSEETFTDGNYPTHLSSMVDLLKSEDPRVRELFEESFGQFRTNKEKTVTEAIAEITDGQGNIEPQSLYEIIRDFFKKLIADIREYFFKDLEGVLDIKVTGEEVVEEKIQEVVTVLEDFNKIVLQVFKDPNNFQRQGDINIQHSSPDFSISADLLSGSGIELDSTEKETLKENLVKEYSQAQPAFRESVAYHLTHKEKAGGVMEKRFYTEVVTSGERNIPSEVIVHQTVVKIGPKNAMGIALEMIKNTNKKLLNSTLLKQGVTLGVANKLTNGNVSIKISSPFKATMANETAIDPSMINPVLVKYQHLSKHLIKQGLYEQHKEALSKLYDKGMAIQVEQETQRILFAPKLTLDTIEKPDFSLDLAYADEPNVYSVPNFVNYIDRRERQIKRLHKDLAKLEADRKIHGKSEALTKRIGYLQRMIDSLEQEIKNFESKTTETGRFEEIVEMFEQDIQRVEELLDQPTVENMHLAKDMLEYIEINADDRHKLANMFKQRDQSEEQDPAVQELFALLNSKKNDLKKKYDQVTDQLVLELMEPFKDNFLKLYPNSNPNLSDEAKLKIIVEQQFKQNQKDIAWLESQFLSEGDTIVAKTDLLAQMRRIIFEMEAHKKQAEANIIIQKINAMLPSLQTEMLRAGFVSKGTVDFLNYLSLFYRKNDKGIVEPYLISKFTQEWDNFLYSTNRDTQEELKKAFSTKPIGNINKILVDKYNKLIDKAEVVDHRLLNDLYPVGSIYRHQDTAAAEAYKQDLIQRLGQSEYDDLIIKQRNLLDEYREEERVIREKFYAEKGVLSEDDLSDTDLAVLDHKLNRLNPDTFAESHFSGNRSFVPFTIGTQTYTNNHFIKYNTFIPKGVDSKNRDTKFFDKDFSVIDNNPILKQAWEVMKEATYTINSNLIDSNLNLNKKSLLWFKKSMKEELFNKSWSDTTKSFSISSVASNTGHFIRGIADATRQAEIESDGIRLPDHIASYKNQVDEAHKINVMRLSSMLKVPLDNKSKVSYSMMNAVDKATFFEEMGIADETEFKRLVSIDNAGNFRVADLRIFSKKFVSEQQTLDLPTMLKVLLEQSSIHAARSITKDKIEALVHTSTNKFQPNPDSTERVNANARTEFFIKSVIDNKTDIHHWGTMSGWARKMNKIREAGGTPTIEEFEEGLSWMSQNLTPEEKATYTFFVKRLGDIDDMMTKVTGADVLAQLSQERSNIVQKLMLMGKDYMVSAAIATTFTKYQILKGMAYNAVAAMFNLTNARMQMHNRDGEFWTMGNAYSALNFVGMRSTRYIDPSYAKQWKIMESLVQRIHVISDGTNEFQRGERTNIGEAPNLFGKIKGIPVLNKRIFTDPLWGTAAVEYYNQVPSFLAMAMDKGITNRVTGETVPLFDGEEFVAYELDSEGNVKLKDEYDTPENRANFLTFSSEDAALFTTQVKNAIDSLNGNYRSSGATMIKNNVAGKQMMAFKTWVPNYAKARYSNETADILTGEHRYGYITGSMISDATRGQGMATAIQTSLLSGYFGASATAAAVFGVGTSLVLGSAVLGVALPAYVLYRNRKAIMNGSNTIPGVFKGLLLALEQTMLTNTVGMIELPTNTAYSMLRKMHLINSLDANGNKNRYLINPSAMIANSKNLKPGELRNLNSFVRQAVLANFSILIMILAQSLRHKDEEDELSGKEGSKQRKRKEAQDQRKEDLKHSIQEKVGTALKNAGGRFLTETNLSVSPTALLGTMIGDNSTAMSGGLPLIEGLGTIALNSMRDEAATVVTNPNSRYYGDSKSWLALRMLVAPSSVKNIDKSDWALGFESMAEKDYFVSMYDEHFSKTDMKKDQKSFSTQKKMSLVEIREQISQEKYNKSYDEITLAKERAIVDKNSDKRFKALRKAPNKLRWKYYTKDKEQKRLDTPEAREYFKELDKE